MTVDTNASKINLKKEKKGGPYRMMTHIGKEREICFLGGANIQENKK
jgi:hypothetical protein